MKAEEAEKARQEEIERAAKAFEDLLARVSEETRKILQETGWDGDPLNISKNPDVLDQSTATLKSNGLPGNTGACVFLSTIYGAADVLDIKLTPEQIVAIYNAAKNNGSVSAISKEGKPMPYYINDYPNLVKTVAAVSNDLPTDKAQLQASAEKAGVGSITCPNGGTLIKTDSKQAATKEIVETLNNNGSVQIRYDADPTKPGSVAHSMRVTGSFIENGNVVLTIKDTYYPDKETFVDTSTYTLYRKDKDGRRVEIERPVYNYRPTVNGKK